MMKLDTQALRWKLAGVIVEASLAVQDSINALSVEDRSKRAPSPLKPPPETSALVDAVGEEAAFRKLELFAQEWGIELRVLVDVTKGSYVSLGLSDGNPSRHFVQARPPPQSQSRTQPHLQQHIWVALDAVDGTLKLCGLGNQPGRSRTVNDGTWAIGLAMTEPTHKAMPEVCIGDFSVALILDGRPQSSSTYPGSTVHPAGALAIAKGTQGSYVTYEICPHGALASDGIASSQQQGPPGTYPSYNWLGPRLHTTSSSQLSQCFVYLDAFQAFDRRTHEPGDDKLAPALYGSLMDRHNGGAFDVLRSYGNLSGLLSTMLGWRGADPAPSTPSAQPLPSAPPPFHSGTGEASIETTFCAAPPRTAKEQSCNPAATADTQTGIASATGASQEAGANSRNLRQTATISAATTRQDPDTNSTQAAMSSAPGSQEFGAQPRNLAQAATTSGADTIQDPDAPSKNLTLTTAASASYMSQDSGARHRNLMQTESTSAADCSAENDSMQSWLEPQCGAFVVLNENLPNLIPSVPIILGAGGNTFHLKTGTDLRGWSLQDGRCSIAYTANPILKLSLQKAVELAVQDKAQT